MYTRKRKLGIVDLYSGTKDSSRESALTLLECPSPCRDSFSSRAVPSFQSRFYCHRRLAEVGLFIAIGKLRKLTGPFLSLSEKCYERVPGRALGWQIGRLQRDPKAATGAAKKHAVIHRNRKQGIAYHSNLFGRVRQSTSITLSTRGPTNLLLI